MKMKTIPFFKFHGAGNDFIMIDNRGGYYGLEDNEVAYLCDRHIGIGADGLIFLETDPEVSFSMRYYNADGKEATLCGNGSRCVVALANMLGEIGDNCVFRASDGLHDASVYSHELNSWVISIEMKDVKEMKVYEDGCFLDTGSPHFVVPVADLKAYPVVAEGCRLRHDARFGQGTNVDFVEEDGDGLKVRTYERGVEDETLSCGTGVTAAALAWALRNDKGNRHYELPVLTRGGSFKVAFDKKTDGYVSISLVGPVVWSFSGTADVPDSACSFSTMK